MIEGLLSKIVMKGCFTYPFLLVTSGLHQGWTESCTSPLNYLKKHLKIALESDFNKDFQFKWYWCSNLEREDFECTILNAHSNVWLSFKSEKERKIKMDGLEQAKQRNMLNNSINQICWSNPYLVDKGKFVF
jgi:hypothetical protein